MIIQHMNNVLVKRNKLLYGVLLVVVVVGFVAVVGGGVDASLFFQSEAGDYATVFEEPVSVEDMKNANDTYVLINLPSAFVANSDGVMRLGADEKMLLQLAVLMKLTEKYGCTASDEDLRNIIKATSAFADEKGNYSAEKYKKFAEYLKLYSYTISDFENALRSFLAIENMNKAMAGAVTATEDEVDRAIKSEMEKLTCRMIAFETGSFADDVQLSDEEILKHYEANSKKYMSLPETDAVLISADLSKITEGDADAKFAEASRKILDVYNEYRKYAEANGGFTAESAVKFMEGREGFTMTELSRITEATPSDKMDGNVVTAVCNLTKELAVSPIVRNGDTASFAVLGARKEAEQLRIEDETTKNLVKADKIQLESEKLASESSRRFCVEVENKKFTPQEIEALVKKYKGTMREPQTLQAAFYRMLLGRMLENGDTAESGRILAGVMNLPEGCVSQIIPVAGGMMLYMEKREPVDEKELGSEDTRSVIRRALEEEKIYSASSAFDAYVQENVKLLNQAQTDAK